MWINAAFEINNTINKSFTFAILSIKFITKLLNPGKSCAKSGPQKGEAIALDNWLLRKCT